MTKNISLPIRRDLDEFATRDIHGLALALADAGVSQLTFDVIDEGLANAGFAEECAAATVLLIRCLLVLDIEIVPG